MAEGQLRETMARKHVAFAALPDESGIVCLQYADALNRTFVAELRGIYWNVPNDIFNGRQRTFVHENGKDYLRGGDYAKVYETIDAGKWVNVDSKIGLASLDKLTVVRNGRRQVEIKWRGIDSSTLYAEEICSPYSIKRRWYDRGENLIDTGFAMTLGCEHCTKKLSESLFAPKLEGKLRAIGVKAKDGKTYVMIANFDEEAKTVDPAALGLGAMTDVVRGADAQPVTLAQDETLLLCVK